MKHAGTTDKGVILSLPLSHEAQFFIETFQCADSHSMSMMWCCSLCHGGQRYPERPHLVCQQVFQPTVHHPLSICSPSATAVCPAHTPLFTVSPCVCPALIHCPQFSHTLLLLSAFDKNMQASQAPHACACSFNTNRTKTEHTEHAHRRIF